MRFNRRKTLFRSLVMVLAFGLLMGAHVMRPKPLVLDTQHKTALTQSIRAIKDSLTGDNRVAFERGLHVVWSHMQRKDHGNSIMLNDSLFPLFLPEIMTEQARTHATYRRNEIIHQLDGWTANDVVAEAQRVFVGYTDKELENLRKDAFQPENKYEGAEKHSWLTKLVGFTLFTVAKKNRVNNARNFLGIPDFLPNWQTMTDQAVARAVLDEYIKTKTALKKYTPHE